MPADLPQLSGLFDAYRQFYGQPADLALAGDFMGARLDRGDSLILVSESQPGGLLIGFCQMYPGFCSVLAKPIFTLYDLYVAPTARGLGTGRQLLAAAHDHAAAEGRARLDLTTARSNRVAQSLYRSDGWVLDEVFLTYTKVVDAAGSGDVIRTRTVQP